MPRYLLAILSFTLIQAACDGTHGQTGERTLAYPPQRGATSDSEVLVHRVFEIGLSAVWPGFRPYVDGPDVVARFRGSGGPASGITMTIRGFWDGVTGHENAWKIRFAPPAAGTWEFTTESSDPGLNGFSGSFTARLPSAAEKAANPLLGGFLARDGDRAWKLADGTPFLPVGDTQWSFAEEFTESEWQVWMNARASQRFNTFLGAVWLAKYSRASELEGPNAGQAFPGTSRGMPGDPGTDQLNIEYFRRLDRMIQHANERGIMMGLAIGGFPDNSAWWERMRTRERDDRWFRYVVARYAAFNVRWILYGEVEERNPPWSTWQHEVARKARLVREADPYDHPIGNHTGPLPKTAPHVAASAHDANIDFIEVQIGPARGGRGNSQYEAARGLLRHGKPLWFEEYWYEPCQYDDDYATGIRNTHQNFVAAPAFPTIGSLMRAHFLGSDCDPRLDQLTTDPGAVRMSYFAEFYTGLEFAAFSADAQSRASRGLAGRFGGTFVVFLRDGGNVAFDMRDLDGTYAVDVLDIHTGERRRLDPIRGGARRIIESGFDGDVSIRLKPQPGTSRNDPD